MSHPVKFADDTKQMGMTKGRAVIQSGLGRLEERARRNFVKFKGKTRDLHSGMRRCLQR